MEKLYKVVEVADILNVTRQSIYRYIKEGDLKSVRVGDNIRIKQSDLDEFIKE